jgi:hypothetical protein
VSAAEKQGTKDQYKIRNRYVDVTDCGDRKTFGKEMRFSGEFGEKCITEISVNIELGLQLYSFAFKVQT